MNGICRHVEYKVSDDGRRFEERVTERNIFKCKEHKKDIGYSDYLAQAANRNLSGKYAAAANARPKQSRGDNPGHRFKNETARKRIYGKILKTIDAKGKKHTYRTTTVGMFKEVRNA